MYLLRASDVRILPPALRREARENPCPTVGGLPTHKFLAKKTYSYILIPVHHKEDKMEFKDFVADALKKKPELQRMLANEFRVADSTVLRWANGVANPHPLTKKIIRQYIIEHA